MRISKVIVENYRQYKGKQKIRLSQPGIYDGSDRNIVVIEGANGAGKSNLLNALTWCLYGVEMHFRRRVDQELGIMNDTVQQSLSEGARELVKVEIHMEDEDDNTVVFSRSMTGQKKNGRISYTTPVLDVFIEKDHNFIAHPEPVFEVNKILPRKVSNFFFFDGEHLDRFFRQESRKVVRDAILDVSQITMLNLAIEHLDGTISRIRRRIKRKDPELEEVRNELATAEDGYLRAKNEMERAEEEKENLNAERRELWSEFSVELTKERKKAKDEHDNIKEQLAKKKAILEQLKRDAKENIVRFGPSILCLNELEMVSDLLEGSVETGRIPGNIQMHFIAELLSSETCICGRDLEDGKPRDLVEELLEESSSSELTSDLTRMKYVIANEYQNSIEFRHKQKEKRAEIDRVNREISTLESKLRDVLTLLDNLGERERNREFRFSQLEEEIKSAEEKMSRLKPTLEEAKRKYEKAKESFDDALERSKEARSEQKKIKLGERILSTLRKVKDKLTNETRELIRSKTEEYFLNLIWKKEAFSDVTIDDDYAISVMTKSGKNYLSYLSAGEREVLALSFLAALRDVSGFEAPIVIDTPLGRISKEPKESIAELLPQYFGGTQVILLMTDEEYSEPVRQRLLPKILYEYELKYDEKSMTTEVTTRDAT